MAKLKRQKIHAYWHIRWCSGGSQWIIHEEPVFGTLRRALLLRREIMKATNAEWCEIWRVTEQIASPAIWRKRTSLRLGVE